jgi:retinol dehydrogenase 14
MMGVLDGALGLATMGAHLAITARDRERTQGAAREIRAAGSGQVQVSADLVGRR